MTDAPGWHAYAEAYADAGGLRARRRRPARPTRFLLYFTSGTTAKPKLVLHTHQSYPVGHLSTMYWIGLRRGRRPPEHQLPRLGQARLEQLLRPVERGRDRLHLPATRASTRQRVLEALVRRGVTTLCAPPTVWRMLILRGPRAASRCGCARW